MEIFGQHLKSQREKKGIRLEEIASITKIHLHSLQHLEASRWKDLPPEPFIRGFIIAYAKYVGLDPKETIDRYAIEVGHPSVEAPPPAELPVVTTSFKQAKKREKREALETETHENPSDVIKNIRTLSTRQIFAGASIATALLVILGVALVGRHFSTRESASTDAQNSDDNGLLLSPKQPEVAAQTQAVTTVENAVAPSAAPIAPVVPPASVSSQMPKSIVEEKKAPGDPSIKHEVVVEGKEKTWLKVVVDDAPPIQYILKAGERANYSAKEKIKLVLGNSTGTQVLHNGDVAPGKQFQGTIRFYIFPKNARFPQDQPKRATTGDETSSSSGASEEKPPSEGAESGTPPGEN